MIKRILLVITLSVLSWFHIVIAQETVRIYTYGEGELADLGDDGILRGTAVDDLVCAMGALGQPYTLGVASMARSIRLGEQELSDIWFPTYDIGGEKSKRLVGPISHMAIFWYIRSGDAESFAGGIKKEGRKFAAISGSYPLRYLRNNGFDVATSSDDPVRLLTLLQNKTIDAVLMASLDLTEYKGAQFLMSQVDLIKHQDLPLTFELEKHFYAKYPDFRDKFQVAFDKCRR